MKKLLLASLCLCLGAAQAQDSVLVVHEKVGPTVDLKEKQEYQLFGYIKNQEFKEAQFIWKNDSTVKAVVLRMDSNKDIREISMSDFVTIRDVLDKTNPRTSQAQPVQIKKELPEFKNRMYLTGGTMLLFSSVGINYEREVAGMGNSKVMIRGGVLWAVGCWGGCETNAALVGGVDLLLGKEGKYFEIDAGAGVMGDFQSVIPIPAINLGFRYERPTKPNVFRVGLGFPESLYLSFGRRF